MRRAGRPGTTYCTAGAQQALNDSWAALNDSWAAQNASLAPQNDSLAVARICLSGAMARPSNRK